MFCSAVHRDVKPSNILLVKNNKEKVVAKLSDFGVSKELYGRYPTKMTTGVGTQGWTARELIVPSYEGSGGDQRKGVST